MACRVGKDRRAFVATREAKEFKASVGSRGCVVTKEFKGFADCRESRANEGIRAFKVGKV